MSCSVQYACDVCKKYVEGPGKLFNLQFICKIENWGGYHYDMCHYCKDKLIDMLKKAVV